ncbi:MAG: hypothetical protein HC800_06155 [Phormidesmis sp. RL_2_1]|nr:hypothetical protein [Phormidesmis sp. RL_2_1]
MNSVLNPVAPQTVVPTTTANMSSHMSTSKKARVETSAEFKKYITFKIAGYLFALPSNEIVKVVATPPPSQGGMVSMGLVQLAQYSIQILDLVQLLALNQSSDVASTPEKIEMSQAAADDSQRLSSAASAQNPPFLMVLQNAEQDLWGIAIEEPPDLMDIPDYALKPVPAEKRLTRALRWVSHVVTYDLGGDRHTLLLLDLSVLLAPQSAETSASSVSPLAIAPPIEPDDNHAAQPEDDDNTARQEEMYASGWFNR